MDGLVHELMDSWLDGRMDAVQVWGGLEVEGWTGGVAGSWRGREVERWMQGELERWKTGEVGPRFKLFWGPFWVVSGAISGFLVAGS